MKRFLLIVFSLSTLLTLAQQSNLILGKNYNTDIHKAIYINNLDVHTSFNPIIKSKLNFSSDSVIKKSIHKEYKTSFLKKIFSEHLIILRGEDYRVIASPIINFSKGKEQYELKNTFENTRGYIIEGDLGEKISFVTTFSENQAVFPNYLDNYIKANRIIPGQGYARIFKETGYDYAMSSGYFSIRLNKMFSVQAGHGKHFIGDGYRSLLLSDNSFNYPYLKLQTTFWKIEYTNLYTEFMDINYFRNNEFANSEQMGYPKKYMSAHYLSLNATKRFNISLFESVIWRMNHAPGSAGFDINYLNPIVMLRPIEFSLNSPDNVLVGINTKYKTTNYSYIYGQLILDEFSLNDLRKKNGFWGNKMGYQLGYKIFDPFKIKNLTLQTEYNYVRPYTYAHHNPQQNYAHYNQPLAHPLGANFSEMFVMANYKWNRFEINAKMMLAKYGGNSLLNDSISFGNNLFMSTGNYANEEDVTGIGVGRPSDFGIEMYQGSLNIIEYKSLNISCIINPYTNLKINLEAVLRIQNNDDGIQKTRFINFGIKTDLFNHYYDI